MKQRFGMLSVLIATSMMTAIASPLTITGSSGTQSFSAVFDNVGNGILQITLTNTGQLAPNDESGVVAALFFSINGNPTLTPISMSLGAGSVIVNGNGDPSANWRYDAGLNGPGGATQGISAAGLGLFGSRGNFCGGANCGTLLHGIDWGIVDAAYTAGSGNASISGQPLIQNAAVFVLSGISLAFDPSIDVTNVNTQFTATLTNTLNITGLDPSAVPEPSTCLLIGTGMILAGLIQRRAKPRDGGRGE